MNKRLQQTALGVALLFGALAPAHAFAAAESVSSEAAVSAQASIAESIIASGYKYLGTPYLYGADATQTNNFDCSSFILLAFLENGISLPRTANDQMGEGYAVTMATAQRGDLLFFRDTTYPDKAGHVGIYLGNNQMLHASGSKGVTVTSLSTPYWQNRFMAVKRVIPATSTYTVQSGDSLWSISRKLSVSIDNLMSWNGLTSSLIYPGQELQLGS